MSECSPSMPISKFLCGAKAGLKVGLLDRPPARCRTSLEAAGQAFHVSIGNRAVFCCYISLPYLLPACAD